MISLLFYSKFIKTGAFQNRCKNNTYSTLVYVSPYVIQHKKSGILGSRFFTEILGTVPFRALLRPTFWRRR